MLLGFEGFDSLSSTLPHLDLNLKPGWLGIFGWVTTAGLLGGRCATYNNSSGGATFTPGSSYSTLIAGVRYQIGTALPGTSQVILQFLDGASVQCGLSVNSSGKLFLWRGTASTVIATGTTTVSLNSWYYIELKVVFSNTGSYELRLGGATELSGSADTTNTANNSATGVNISISTNGYSMDDFYLCDGTGSAPHNDFLGVVRVETAFPTANDSVAWTPNASTNVSRVQETLVDDDTTYNSTSTSGAVDTFSHGALSSTPTTIFGVAVTAKIRKDDVVAKSARTKLKSGATTQNGASNSIDTSYKYIRDQYTTDPDTGVAWTATNVNASKIGYELI